MVVYTSLNFCVNMLVHLFHILFRNREVFAVHGFVWINKSNAVTKNAQRRQGIGQFFKENNRKHGQKKRCPLV